MESYDDDDRHLTCAYEPSSAPYLDTNELHTKSHELKPFGFQCYGGYEA